MKHTLSLVVAALAVTLLQSSQPALSKDKVQKLSCTKGTPTKADAELTYVESQSIYTLNVTFIATRPSSKSIDPLQRACLAEAVKTDSSKDILVTPWFRAKVTDKPNDDEMLSPYGSLTNLIYEAKTKTSKLHKLELKKKSG